MSTPMLDGVMGSMSDSGIRWSLLRPREALASAEGDIDVLVEPADMDRVRRVVDELGLTRMPLDDTDLHAAGYDEASGRFVWLHIQTALRLAGSLIPAGPVLAEAGGEEAPQPDDSWLLWILLLRALVDKGKLPERHRATVQKLAAGWRGGPERLEHIARDAGIDPQRAASAAAAGDWGALMAQSVHSPPPPPSWRTRLRRLPASLRRLLHPSGMSVAVIGPDGAGKTTLVRSLARTLPLPVRVQYMGLTGGRMPRADALRVPGLVFLARVGLLWARYLRGLVQEARGGIVVFERYVLDGAVPSGVRLSLAGRLSRRLQRRAVPLPDLVLLLDARGGTLHERSGEYEPETLESWRSAYEGLRRSVDQLEVIDAEQPSETVLREAQALIWRRYAELRADA